jgi:hypothetical protein
MRGVCLTLKDGEWGQFTKLMQTYILKIRISVKCLTSLKEDVMDGFFLLFLLTIIRLAIPVAALLIASSLVSKFNMPAQA